MCGGIPALRVGKHHHAHRVHDRLLPPRVRTALPAVPAGTQTVRNAVRARTAALSPADAKRYNDAQPSARGARQAGGRHARTEVAAVIATVEGIQSRGAVIPSRVNALVLTLQRNTHFWPANAAWSSCRSKGDTTCTTLRGLLDAMISLAAQRGTFSAWEYDFAFEGGVPPWMSGMSQATGIQALSRAYKLTGVTRYRDAATAALAAFETAPPTGIARPATNGTHYLMYSYAPDLFIFNGHYQALLGLDDYRDITGDPRGTTLFRAGHAHGRWLLPYADTGSWSLYSLGGPQSTVEYHALLTDFIQTLCKRVGTPVYCDTAAGFTQHLAARGG